MIRVNKELLDYISDLIKQGNEKIYLEEIGSNNKIISQGRNATTVYVLKKGIAKCYLTDRDGNEFIQEFFGEGQLFGEVEVVHGTLSVCSVESISEAEIYCMTKDYFKWLLSNDKQFNNIIVKALTTKIAYKAHRHSYNQYHSIAASILRLQNILPELLDVIPKQDIANYLGTSLRSLNRALKTI